MTDGAWPFEALGRLPIDVSVVGNHELDWGMDDLRRRSAELPFELLAANLPGFPADAAVRRHRGSSGSRCRRWT